MNPKVTAITDIMNVRSSLESMRNVGLIDELKYKAHIAELKTKAQKATDDYFVEPAV